MIKHQFELSTTAGILRAKRHGVWPEKRFRMNGYRKGLFPWFDKTIIIG